MGYQHRQAPSRGSSAVGDESCRHRRRPRAQHAARPTRHPMLRNARVCACACAARRRLRVSHPHQDAHARTFSASATLANSTKAEPLKGLCWPRWRRSRTLRTGACWLKKASICTRCAAQHAPNSPRPAGSAATPHGRARRRCVTAQLPLQVTSPLFSLRRCAQLLGHHPAATLWPPSSWLAP